jgi:hypothetical protein
MKTHVVLDPEEIEDDCLVRSHSEGQLTIGVGTTSGYLPPRSVRNPYCIINTDTISSPRANLESDLRGTQVHRVSCRSSRN